MVSWKSYFICLFVLPALMVGSGCGGDNDPAGPGPVPEADLTLLSLGDSYTVGHSLRAVSSWPYQLADTLAAAGDSLSSFQVIAKTGWTTRDLLGAVRDSLATGGLPAEPFGLVTLMIGVNNQYKGVEPAVFEAEMDTLISLALDLAEGDPSRVIGFSIPDYGLTPVGQLFDSRRIALEVIAHNVILERKYRERGIIMLDIHPLSLLVVDEPQLVAKDGLHYSGEMYARWVSLMLPSVRSALGLATQLSGSE